MALGKKQTANQSDFLKTLQNIETIISRIHAENLVDRAVEEIKPICRGKRVGWAWSGGKDSQALRVAMEAAGIEPCVMGMTNLEYPEFLKWVTDQMPWELDVINTGQDLKWLADNLQMLFPQESKTAAKWFRIVQHRAQQIFYERHRLDIIILGRRKADGNYTGPAGQNIYTNKAGITRYSPIETWSHEEVIAICHYFNQPLAPIYWWPNGFVVGTGAWAARQWTGSVDNGWREVYAIDKHIVIKAAQLIPSARKFLERIL